MASGADAIRIAMRGWEPCVIECGARPRGSGVAGGARGGKACGCVVGVSSSRVIGLMA